MHVRSRWLALAGLALFLLAGCGGGGGGGSQGPLTFVDSQGRAFSGTLPTGRALRLGVTAQPPRCNIDVQVNGPSGLVAQTRLATDRNGVLPPATVVPELPNGTYTLIVKRLAKGQPDVVLTQQTLTVAPVAGIPTLTTGLLNGSTFTPSRVFAPGESVAVQASGLPANQTADLYVVPADGALTTGQTLVDVSGWHANRPTPVGQHSRVLQGSADTLQTDASGQATARIVWSDLNAQALDKGFRLVLDRNRDGFYQPQTDLTSDPEAPAFVVHQVTRAVGDREVDLVTDSNGNPTSQLRVDELIQVGNDPRVVTTKTEGYLYKVVADKDNWATGDPLVDVSDPDQRQSYSDELIDTAPPSLMNGRFILYYADLAPGQYDIVVDVDGDGIYTQGVDYIDGSQGYAVKVDGSPLPRQKWTVMVYLNGDNNLDDFAIKDLEEMELVDTVPNGGTPEVSIVVQLDRYKSSVWQEARRYIVGYNPNPGFDAQSYERLGEVNMGDPKTLSSFISWAKAVRPADHYALVVWDHGDGFRTRANKRPTLKNISWDDTDNGDSLTVDAIHTVLMQQGGVDLLVFDACLMGMADLVAEFDDVTRAVVAAQNTEPGYSHDFTFVKDLVANPNMTAVELGNVVVRYWEAFYARAALDTTSACFDMSKAQALRTAIDTFANLMLDDPDGNGPQQAGLARNGVRTAVLDTIAAATRMEKDDPIYDSHKDLIDFFTRLKAALPDSQLAAACDPILAATRALMTATYIDNTLPGHNGTAFWVPNKDDYLLLKPDYATLRFARMTHWDEFLDALYKVLYRVEFSAPNAEFTLSPIFFEDWDPEKQGGYAQPQEIPGFIRDFEYEDTKPLKTITITADAPDKDFTLFGTYVDLPLGVIWRDSGTLTVKLYRGSETTPLHTLSNQFKVRNGTSYDHWKVLILNPIKGTITIEDKIVGVGF